MPQNLAHIALLIPDYDEAIHFYTQTLNFDLIEDTPREPGKRWVRVRPPAAPGTTPTDFLLAKAVNPQQHAAIGNQSGGRVFLFLHTDNFARDHAAYTAKGVTFDTPPRHEVYGTVAVFTDRYGNRWDLIEPKPA